MRFPHEAYAKMKAQEESAISRRVVQKNAAEKQTISESAIENDDDNQFMNEPEEDEVDEEVSS